MGWPICYFLIKVRKDFIRFFLILPVGRTKVAEHHLLFYFHPIGIDYEKDFEIDNHPWPRRKSQSVPDKN